MAARPCEEGLRATGPGEEKLGRLTTFAGLPYSPDDGHYGLLRPCANRRYGNTDRDIVLVAEATCRGVEVIAIINVLTDR